jgi:hypothetical protein
MIDDDDPDPDAEGWITFYEAAYQIRHRLGGSFAEAKSKLRRACADEKIDTMWAPYDEEHDTPAEQFEHWTLIAPSDG